MSEVLVQFDTTVSDGDGEAYVARICGRLAEDGLWEGWIEFDPRGTAGRRTPRETEQHDRREIGAVDEVHLRNILRAYDLARDDSRVLRAAERAALAEAIVVAVRRRAG
jgi:hypothetical protein